MPDRAPPHPHLVLATAILLPGCGQVLNGQTRRGLTYVFFIILLGGFTLISAAPETSWIGQLAGGLFVWAMSIPDAYRTARLRYAIWQNGVSRPAGN